MGAFGYISAASEEETIERYRMLGKMGRGLREIILPRMPEYIYGTIRDMGVPGQSINGYWMQLPDSEKGIAKSRLLKAANRCRQFGADAVVVDRSLHVNLSEYEGLTISNGMLYPPFAFIEGLEKVAALMGFDFRMSNVCIADAATETGVVMTELLLDRVLHITLCTKDRDSLSGRINGYILDYGVSPVVMSNYRKAVLSSDVLIYTGRADIAELSSYVMKKMLIVNMSGKRIELQKDLLSFDEVILKSGGMSQVSGDAADADEFMRSGIWEGALMCISGLASGKYTAENSRKIYRTSKEYGIDVKSVMRDGKVLDRYSIYKYR